MRILEVSLRRFRGFEDLTFQPDNHVALLGEPRAGRSDLIEGLRRVLTSDGTRHTTPAELDLWMLDKTERAEVEVTIGDLGPVLEQDFVDHTEAWDPELRSLAEPKPPTQAVTVDATSWVLRICYRIEWDDNQDQAVHWVDFPAESDPDSGVYVRVPKRLHDLLPVVVVEGNGRPLRLGPQSDFRRIIDQAGSSSLGDALDAVVDAVGIAGSSLAKTADIKSNLTKVLEPVEASLGIDASEEDLVQFVPEGGSLSGILRSLQPAIDLGGPGHLPLHRHGTTTAALLQAGEAIAAIGDQLAVILTDDFGEGVDPIGARHLSSVLRLRAGQAWISTRRSSAVEAFPPQEIVRLFHRRAVRHVAQIGVMTTKAERVAARHLSIQLLPAASAGAIAIVEGPHDRAALDAMASRLTTAGSRPLPAAQGIAIVDAGVADGSGGAPAVARLATLATRLGFYVVGVIDGDKGNDGKAYLASAIVAADRVIRLPEGAAIEVALIDGLDRDVVVKTLKTLCETFDADVPKDLDIQTGAALLKSVVAVLKKNGGLHAQFVELLPSDAQPTLLEKILHEIVESANTRQSGPLQL